MNQMKTKLDIFVLLKYCSVALAMLLSGIKTELG